MTRPAKTSTARPGHGLLPLLAGTILATALPLAAQAQQAATGGVVHVAIIGQPDTLDPMVSTKDVVGTVTQNIFETLYAFDAKWQPSPLLAEAMPKITDDGKTYTIALRQGITFQNGEKMTSADVVASLQRWEKVAARGQAAAPMIDSISASDDHTVVIKLKQPFAPLLPLLSMNNSAAVIVPKDDIGPAGLKKIVGTGPYELKANKPDQYIQLAKFKDYQSRKEAPDGAAGGREQNVDEIDFIPVPDENTRLEGLLSGQFDYAESISPEGYDRLEKSQTAEPVLLKNYGWPVFANNLRAGLMTNPDIRKAVQAALNEDDMLYAAFGDEKFFQTDGALYPEGYPWHSTEGTKLYDMHDIAKAKEYLKKAHYDGTPLRILTSHQYEFHFKMAQVAQMELQAAGFKVKLIVVDWATLGQMRNNPKEWDIFITHSPFIPEPTLNSLYTAASQVGWNDPKKEKLFAEFSSETDMTKRAALFGQFQKLYFEDVPFFKIGNFNDLRGQSKKLSGVPQSPWEFFWNAKLSK